MARREYRQGRAVLSDLALRAFPRALRRGRGSASATRRRPRFADVDLLLAAGRGEPGGSSEYVTTGRAAEVRSCPCPKSSRRPGARFALSFAPPRPRPPSTRGSRRLRPSTTAKAY